jgi:hypothetical protein
VVEPDNYSLAGNFVATLVDSAHSDYNSMKNWGDFTTLHCMCWSTDCSFEDNYFGPHSSLALDL